VYYASNFLHYKDIETVTVVWTAFKEQKVKTVEEMFLQTLIAHMMTRASRMPGPSY